MAAAPEPDEPVDALHANSKIQQVEIERVQVDRSYQRDPSMVLVDKIADEWNLISSELVLISDRGPRPEGSEVGGGLYIVNGQHRLRAARKLGHKKIWARVIDLTDADDPAAIEASYRLQTNVRLGDRIHERFKAQLRAGHEESHAIVRLLARFDAEINLIPTTESGINCITTIETIYRVDEGALLNDVLEILRGAHTVVGGKNINAGYLKGLSWFVEKHSMDCDRGRVIEKLGVMGVRSMEQRARAMQSTYAGPLWINYYRALVDLYNEKLAAKNRLELSTRGQGALRPRSEVAASQHSGTTGPGSGAWGKS
jgi:hypothetical protein